MIAMAHYTGYFGTLLMLWIFMVLTALGVGGLFRELLLLLLALLSLLFGIIGLVYVVGGVGFARRG
jgi:hypothetical protein